MQAGEHLVELAIILVVQVRVAEIPGIAGIQGINEHQVRGIPHRHRVNEKRIDDSENGGIGANSKAKDSTPQPSRPGFFAKSRAPRKRSRATVRMSPVPYS